MGSIAITDPAINRFHSTLNWPWKVLKPTGNVRIAGEFVTISGQRKSFQVLSETKIASAASTGPLSGRITDHQIRNDDAPSMRAASSRSNGMPRKYWRSRKVLKAENAGGRISAW